MGETGNTFKRYQNISTHIYIPTYVSPQKLVTYVPVTLCHHCMSDKMTGKDLSKGLKVLSGMRIMRDALMSAMREKKGNNNISRKKEKKNLSALALHNVVSENMKKTQPQGNHLLQELHFGAENYFQLGCFPGLTCRKNTLRLQSPTVLGLGPESC